MPTDRLFTITYDGDARWIVAAVSQPDAVTMGRHLLLGAAMAAPGVRANGDPELLDAREPTADEREQWDGWARTFGAGSEVAPAAMPLESPAARH